MSKCCVHYSCGHYGQVELFGRSIDKNYKVKKIEKSVCPECKALESDKINAEFEREWELPELTGTQKQVSWARPLRKQLLLAIVALHSKKIVDDNMMSLSIQYFSKIVDAEWYIRNRKKDVMELISTCEDEQPEPETFAPDDDSADDIKNVLYPECAQSEDIAYIFGDEKEVLVSSVKNETIIESLKKNGMRWNGKTRNWYIKLNETTGGLADMQARIGNALLNDGIPVKIDDDSVRSRAVSGDFPQLYRRWISIIPNTRYVQIDWEQGNYSMLGFVMSLPNVKARGKGATVNSKYYDSIREFAELNDFKFTKMAMELLDDAEAHDKKKVTVSPAKTKEIDYDMNNVSSVLYSSRSVIDDLKDD